MNLNSKSRLVISLVIAVIITMSLTTIVPAQTVPLSIVPRLRSDDPRQIALIRQKIAKDPGYTVVFIGDSLLYSSASKLDQDTIASRCYQSLTQMIPNKNIHVYDLTLPGCTMANSYDIAKYIMPAKPDMIVFDVNVAWFSITKPEHPILQNLNALTINPRLKANPVVKFSADLYKPWFEKNFSHLKKGQGKLGVFNASINNANWTAFQKTVDLFNGQPTVGVFIYPPRNSVLYYRYQLFDNSSYLRCLEELSVLLGMDNILTFNYTWKLDSQLFSDNAHMLAPGNIQLGKIIAEDIFISKVIETPTITDTVYNNVYGDVYNQNTTVSDTVYNSVYSSVYSNTGM
ncbi:MAG: hypothetical protein ACM3PP_12360 [Candidatus Saccharibacteria bacterium]